MDRINDELKMWHNNLKNAIPDKTFRYKNFDIFCGDESEALKDLLKKTIVEIHPQKEF